MFAELIAESFHSMTDLTWAVMSTKPGVAVAKLQTNEVSVEVSFEERADDWTVSFAVLQPSQAVYTAFHIFNGVFQAVVEFIETRQPDVLVFVTKKKGLADIYNLYLRRENERIAKLGYRLEPISDIDPNREYTLVRVTPRNWSPL